MKMKTFKIGDFITFGGAIVSDVRKVELHETLTVSDGRKLDFDGSYYAADVPKPGGGNAVKGMMLGADFYMLLCYENLSGKMEQGLIPPKERLIEQPEPPLCRFWSEPANACYRNRQLVKDRLALLQLPSPLDNPLRPLCASLAPQSETTEYFRPGLGLCELLFSRLKNSNLFYNSLTILLADRNRTGTNWSADRQNKVSLPKEPYFFMRC